MNFIGFDCETINGKSRLIGLSDGRHFKIKSEKDAFNFLYDHKDGLNLVAYNADYDIQSLLTYFPLKIKKRLMHEVITHVELDGRKLTLLYIVKKYLKFGNSYIFDVFQFYGGKLESAAKKYLGKGKLSFNVASITSVNIYLPKTIKYCIQDAILAKELMDLFVSDLPDHLKTVKPISPAFYSGSHFSKELKANLIPADINKQFRKAYHGGRFEVYKRGFFKEVYFYDLNSAYPKHITELKTLIGSHFSTEKEYRPQADYSVYLLECIIRDKFVSPVVYKYKNSVSYPIGYFKGYVTKGEFERIQKYDPKILGALHLYCVDDFPFREKVLSMYKRKQESKYSPVYKCLLNSLYGRTAMATKRWRKDIGLEDVYGIYTDPETGEVFYKVEDAFSSNFVYASEITARTRLQMYDVVNAYRDNIIAVQTDGVFSTKPLDLPISLNLGDWKMELWTDLYVIGSGIYFYKVDGKQFGKFRGFSLSDNRTETILESILKSKSSKVEFQTKKRYSIKECIRLKDEDRENKILDVIRTMDLNFDRKRTWLSEWSSGDEVQSNVIESLGIMNLIL